MIPGKCSPTIVLLISFSETQVTGMEIFCMHFWKGLSDKMMYVSDLQCVIWSKDLGAWVCLCEKTGQSALCFFAMIHFREV